MPETISINGKRANATIFASNLINHVSQVIFLTAYGPTQEVRAFAQILLEGGDIESDACNIKGASLGGIMKIIPGMPNGYSGLYVIPAGNKYIVGDTDDDCFNILSRVLDQAYFVHRNWYEEISKLNAKLPSKIGTKRCFIMVENLEEEVRNRVKYGSFQFPVVTARLTIEKKEVQASTN